MNRSNKRCLQMESLERRALLAADCHNFFAPLDVNDDASITASDALMVINRLNGDQERMSNSPAVDGFIDVTDDGVVTPVDALKIINWLNDRRVADTTPSSDWIRLKGEGESRMGVRMKQADDGSVEIEVRLQNAAKGQSKEIFLDDQWIGSIQADARGRGQLKIDSNNELADRMAELLIEGRKTATLAVDSVGQVELENSGTKNEARTSENRLLLDGNVFSARLNLEGQQRGEVLFAQRGNDQFLGFYARGLMANQDYDIKINGVVVDTATANGRGVITKRINTAEVANFPEIQVGTVVEIANYRGEFITLKDRVRIPRSVHVANLSGNRMLGAAELLMTNDRTVIGVQLGRVEPNTTFPLFVDDIKIADVKSGPRGVILFRFDSARGDKLLADLPTITENSLIKVGDIARGKLVKLGR